MPYGGLRGGALSYERGTPVRPTIVNAVGSSSIFSIIDLRDGRWATQCFPAAEQKENTSKGCKDNCLTTKARIWP
jgi:hypothetical protein